MADLVLTKVDPRDLGERTVLGFTSFPLKQPFSTGPGDLNLLCADCGFVLVAGTAPMQAVPALVIRCPSCGGYNDACSTAVPA